MMRRFLSTSAPALNATKATAKRGAFQINFGQPKQAQVSAKEVSQQPESVRINPKFVKNFKSGATYDPFDFSLARLHLDKKFATRHSKNELFDKHGLDPLALYSNPEFLSQFVSSGGRIMHRDASGLSAKNQRKISKAIRRAQAIGLMSSVSKDVSMLPLKTITRRK